MKTYNNSYFQEEETDPGHYPYHGEDDDGGIY